MSPGAVFTLSKETWKLISIFSDDRQRMVGAYCPLPDYTGGMGDMTRAQLVLQFDAVEVALLSDIKLWISASTSADGGGRSRSLTQAYRSGLNLLSSNFVVSTKRCAAFAEARVTAL